MNRDDSRYLAPTAILDSDHETVVAFAREAVAGREGDPKAEAVALFYAVRDRIWYDPYVPFYEPEHFRSSAVLARGSGFCIHKAGLLAAAARARGIPARLGFANVRNHLTTRQLREHMGTDVFSFHGFTELALDGRWVKATPAFNVELCERHGVAPLEFDGEADCIFQPLDLAQNRFMEYVDDLGVFDDIPVEDIVAEWRRIYGSARVDQWIAFFDAAGGRSLRDFMREEVVT
jgi:transglutaminase-like putative cysteine protease